MTQLLTLENVGGLLEEVTFGPTSAFKLIENGPKMVYKERENQHWYVSLELAE